MRLPHGRSSIHLWDGHPTNHNANKNEKQNTIKLGRNCISVLYNGYRVNANEYTLKIITSELYVIFLYLYTSYWSNNIPFVWEFVDLYVMNTIVYLTDRIYVITCININDNFELYSIASEAFLASEKMCIDSFTRKNF